MPPSSLRVEVTDRARADLAVMRGYWQECGEAWRGEKYHRDLMQRAELELSDVIAARRGRRSKVIKRPDVREILAFSVYRIIYRIDEATATVFVLRFWHAHRDATDGDV